MSGYKDDGTDLDSIFYIIDATKSISAEYKVEGATSYGLFRTKWYTANASEDTGYEINGVDLNRTYARKEDVRQMKFLLKAGNSTADGYQNAGLGADLKFTMHVQKGTTLTFGRVPGGVEMQTNRSTRLGWSGWRRRGCSILYYRRIMKVMVQVVVLLMMLKI